MATSSSARMATGTARPALARQDVSSDNLLSYYSSPLADNPQSVPVPVPISRHSSVDSTSDYSDCSYKSESTPSDYSTNEEPIVAGPASVQRRTSESSKGAADRRRLAIVQVGDSDYQSHKANSVTTPTSSTKTNRRRSRRAGSGNLALIAPPDVSLELYMTEETQKPSFPTSTQSQGLPWTSQRSPPSSYNPQTQGHQRSASENSKRDIAIIGTLPSQYRSSLSAHPASSKAETRSKSSKSEDSASGEALHPPPLFLRPQSRSPSPGVTSQSGHSDIVTPDIGEGKPIDVPVAGPVVVMTSLDLRSPTSRLDHSATTSANSSTATTHKTSSASSGSSTSAPPQSHSTAPHTTHAIIPPSAQIQTPQKQRTTPSIVVLPHTPQTPKSLTSFSPFSTTFSPTTPTLNSIHNTPKSPDLSTKTMSSTATTSTTSYRDYRPGVHSTAGPLPPPPRASFVVGTGGAIPPPRPPRQVRSPSPTKSSSGRSSPPTASSIPSSARERGKTGSTREDPMEALRLPAEVTAALSSRLAPVAKAKSTSGSGGGSVISRMSDGGRAESGADEKSLNSVRSHDMNERSTSSPYPEKVSITISSHTREGAFAPSTIISPATPTTMTTTSMFSTAEPTMPETSPTTKLRTLHDKRRKIASSSSYEEYALNEEEEESDYGEVDKRENPTEAVIKPPPRKQSLGANAIGISGLPRSSIEEEGWILADHVSGVGGNGKSLDGIPKTPSRPGDQRPSLDSPSSSNESDGPSPPPKSFRNSFSKGLKRLSSLNASPRRSASISSRSAHSRTPSQASSSLPPVMDNDDTRRRSFSPSPSANTFHSLPPSPNPPQRPSLDVGSRTNLDSSYPSDPYLHQFSRPHPHAHRRIVNPAPAALFCSEIYSAPKKSSTSAERCAIYARKLNELYLYDCGLSDWVLGVGLVRAPSHGVSTISFTETPRKTSQGSTMSEATFPRRPDATTATDLMLIPPTISSESSISSASPSARLPYPALASNKEKTGLLGSLTTPSAGRGGGFFASLGRKTSINRHRAGSSNDGHPSGGKTRLTKPPPSATVNVNTISSPILVNSTHNLPGGPRALPGRAKTLMLSPSPSPVKDQFSGNTSGSESGSNVGRRPSMYNLGSSSMSESVHGNTYLRPERQEKENDQVFMSQVNRLADLLPHVEKDVLAGYLRRAGQDILAIGQYLDDEKNGCVRRD